MITKRNSYVLVVDDLESWRDLLTAILESDGYQVATASTFEEARSLLEVERFDMAILDIRLVDTSVHNIQGMDLLREAKRLNPSIKAIILTGYPDPGQKAKALDFYGADDYLEKAPEGQPFDVDYFDEVVSDLLQD